MVRAVFRGAVAAREALGGLPGVVGGRARDRPPGRRGCGSTASQGADPRRTIFRLAVEKGWVLRELAREALSLEDVFVRLTRRDEAAPEAPARPRPRPAPAAEGEKAPS